MPLEEQEFKELLSKPIDSSYSIYPSLLSNFTDTSIYSSHFDLLKVFILFLYYF